ncbi:MAG: ankyrin repeat domain-containing protein [archaeon]|nr:ankyrin repeat domain-containing protein [archaeon]
MERIDDVPCVEGAEYFSWQNGVFKAINGKKTKDSFPVSLNPFKVLNVTEASTEFEIELKFKQKLFEEPQLRSEICLAFEILSEPNLIDSPNYINQGDNYTATNLDGFYCSIVGDDYGMLTHILEDKSILNSYDKKGCPLLCIAARNGHLNVCQILIDYGADINIIDDLGNTPLHGASYHGHEDVMNLLLSYGAKIDIQNLLERKALEDAPTQRISNIITESSNDLILNLYHFLDSVDLVSNLIKVKKFNKRTQTDDFIAIKFLPSVLLLPENVSEIKKTWVPAWHGTKFKNVESILREGLKESGSVLGDGSKVTPDGGHIPMKMACFGVNDWANAIFLSPSVFYSANEIYSEKIRSSFYENKDWYVLIEARLNPGKFKSFTSTTTGYNPLPGEPKNVEYRIKEKDEAGNPNTYVTSITFIWADFIKNLRFYEDGDLLSNTEAERNLVDDWDE